MEYVEKMRHSLAHLLASVVMEFWPKTKLAIGPAIDNGFYYDMELPQRLTPEDLQKIEQRIRELIGEHQKFIGKKVSKAAARKLFKHQPYKLEIIKELPGDTVGTYQNGGFLDLCKGGHVGSTKEIDPNAFKLIKIAGAYWKGDEKNSMLTRIYGVAFATEQELVNYLKMQEEAKKRDHRILGEKLDLFTISEKVGKGLPLFTPKGTILRELLNEYSQELRAKKGWQKVWSPHIAKNELYKISGHWDKFGDELFLVKSQETSDELVLKPMNCPHHQQIYESKPRSYRELPIKYMETTTVYRDEKAGELLGLSRVRSITQDDSHTFCTPEQIEQVYQELIEITKEFYATLDMPIKARLSFRGKKDLKHSLGEPKLWEHAEKTLFNIAKKNSLNYFIAEGEAAFYGPKIDFMATDAFGREWQLATPQLDFVQPQRFGLTYTDREGKAQTPVIIHFALMGALERFISIYLEHTAGVFPVWLSPVQVAILPISNNQIPYANEIAGTLKAEGFRLQVMDENETLGKKIRESEIQRIPYLIIVGDKEVASQSVSIRERGKGDLGQMPIEKFLEKITEATKKKI